MTLFFEIGEVVKTDSNEFMECVERGCLSCDLCYFGDKPSLCSCVSCNSGQRSDGTNVVFLRQYKGKGGAE